MSRRIEEVVKGPTDRSIGPRSKVRLASAREPRHAPFTSFKRSILSLSPLSAGLFAPSQVESRLDRSNASRRKVNVSGAGRLPINGHSCQFSLSLIIASSVRGAQRLLAHSFNVEIICFIDG